MNYVKNSETWKFLKENAGTMLPEQIDEDMRRKGRTSANSFGQLSMMSIKRLEINNLLSLWIHSYVTTFIVLIGRRFSKWRRIGRRLRLFTQWVIAWLNWMPFKTRLEVWVVQFNWKSCCALNAQAFKQIPAALPTCMVSLEQI